MGSQNNWFVKVWAGDQIVRGGRSCEGAHAGVLTVYVVYPRQRERLLIDQPLSDA